MQGLGNGAFAGEGARPERGQLFRYSAADPGDPGGPGQVRGRRAEGGDVDSVVAAGLGHAGDGDWGRGGQRALAARRPTSRCIPS